MTKSCEVFLQNTSNLKESWIKLLDCVICANMIFSIQMNAEIWSTNITYYIATLALHEKWQKKKALVLCLHGHVYTVMSTRSWAPCFREADYPARMAAPLSARFSAWFRTREHRTPVSINGERQHLGTEVGGGEAHAISPIGVATSPSATWRASGGELQCLTNIALSTDSGIRFFRVSIPFHHQNVKDILFTFWLICAEIPNAFLVNLAFNSCAFCNYVFRIRSLHLHIAFMSEESAIFFVAKPIFKAPLPCLLWIWFNYDWIELNWIEIGLNWTEFESNVGVWMLAFMGRP